jgi:pimeloyl-ACP methyl ester carboxylesterase
MLHSWFADHLGCTRFLEPIFKRRSGWKRIYPDLPGMGRTPAMDWITEQDDVLDVVLNFIRSVVPGQNVSIAGHSYGSYLAQGVVYQKPALVNGVFLLAPSIGVDERERSLPRHVTLVENKALIEELEPDEAELFQSAFVVQSRKTLDEFKDYFRRAIRMADQEYLSRLENNYTFSFDVRVLREPFDRPVLILTGRQDSVVGYRDAWGILENYPRATFAVLDRAGHLLPYEQEHLLYVLVNEWLDRVEEYSGVAG